MTNATKTKSLVTLLLAASATSLTAIERPVPAEQPREKKAQEVKPRVNEKAPPMPKAKEARVAQRAYLGVMGNPTSDAMSAQLNLAPNTGLTLLFVEEGSPADKAGLKKHDIITKLGGVQVGNQNQLREAILKHQPSNKVELSYISGGKAITKQVELGSAPMVDRGNRRHHHGEAILPKLNKAIPLDMLQNLPPEQRQQLQQLLEGNLNQLDMGNLKNLDFDQLQKQFDGFGNMPRLKMDMNDMMKQGFQQQGRMKMVDPEGSITLETHGDKKTIELHDAEGNLQYKGPYNNDADKLKIPENLRERANRLKFHNKPKALALPHFRQFDDLRGFEALKRLQNMEFPRELQNLFNQLEAQEEMFQGFAFPKGGNLRDGHHMHKFQFNLNDKNLTKHSSKSLIGPDGKRYTLNENKDGKEIEIKDSDGKLLFSGPYNSSVDIEMVPEEYRPSLEKLDAMGSVMKGNLR